MTHQGDCAINDGAVSSSRRVTILGIGNTLLTDEGVGVHVVNQLSSMLGDRSEIDLVDGGTLGLELLAMVEDTKDLIVIDAAMMGGNPGDVRVLIGTEMDQYLGLPRRSAHEVGLRDLLDLAALDGRLPPRRALIGVQPERIDWGDMPTLLVRQAVPLAALHALELAQAWSRDLALNQS